MRALPTDSRVVRVLVFVVLDVAALGAGMGVPVFNILLGAPVGWSAARRQTGSLQEAMRGCLRVALLTSLVTLAAVATLWLPWVPTVWGPEAAVLRSGVPMVLYEPRASLAGWIALMVIVSPILQALVTLASSYVVLMRRPSNGS